MTLPTIIDRLGNSQPLICPQCQSVYLKLQCRYEYENGCCSHLDYSCISCGHAFDLADYSSSVLAARPRAQPPGKPLI